MYNKQKHFSTLFVWNTVHFWYITTAAFVPLQSNFVLLPFSGVSVSKWKV